MRGWKENIVHPILPLEATNRNLEAMVRADTFREDFCFRVNLITIDGPSLRDRAGDVELLARTFCHRIATTNNKALREVSPAAVERLRARDCPGNVRELEDVMERAVVLGHGNEIQPEHLASSSQTPASRDTSSRQDLIDVMVESV